MPGLLVYRFDAPPFFVNAEYLRQRVLAARRRIRGRQVVGAQRRGVDVLRRDGDRRPDSAPSQNSSNEASRSCFARLKGRQREIFEETGLTAADRA